MTGMLELTVDKFTFRVPVDRLYSADGVWVQPVAAAEPGRVRVGVTDFVQQHSGDVAFARVQPAGTVLRRGDEIATLETIKVDLSLPCPVAGRVAEANSALDAAPETVNQDPYGAGWLAVVDAAAWDTDRAMLLAAEAYLGVMKARVQSEVQS